MTYTDHDDDDLIFIITRLHIYLQVPSSCPATPPECLVCRQEAAHPRSTFLRKPCRGKQQIKYCTHSSSGRLNVFIKFLCWAFCLYIYLNASELGTWNSVCLWSILNPNCRSCLNHGLHKLPMPLLLETAWATVPLESLYNLLINQTVEINHPHHK